MKGLLKKHLEYNGKSQEDFANEIGMHKSTVKRILGTLNGQVSIFTRVKVANYLDENHVKKYDKMDNNNTKHYSDRCNVLLFNLLDGLDRNIRVVEPFVGNGSLLEYLDEFEVECYDILPEISGAKKQDTLLNPPNYSGKYVVTNPPYLAKNKSKDKAVFEKYGEDDLYKAFISSIIVGGVAGGVVIVPLNFLTDENSEQLRREFFSKYRVENLNIFKCQMFDYTKYNTVSFNFFLGEQTHPIDTVIFEDRNIIKHIEVGLVEEYGYRLFGEFYNEIKPFNNGATRYLYDHQFPTNIKVKCLDGVLEESKIRAEICHEPKIGDKKDRTEMILVFNRILPIEMQEKMVHKFNKFMRESRDKYHNLIFTNFRENNRKRVGFELVYDIFNMILEECEVDGI